MVSKYIFIIVLCSTQLLLYAADKARAQQLLGAKAVSLQLHPVYMRAHQAAMAAINGARVLKNKIETGENSLDEKAVQDYAALFVSYQKAHGALSAVREQLTQYRECYPELTKLFNTQFAVDSTETLLSLINTCKTRRKELEATHALELQKQRELEEQERAALQAAELQARQRQQAQEERERTKKENRARNDEARRAKEERIRQQKELERQRQEEKKKKEAEEKVAREQAILEQRQKEQEAQLQQKRLNEEARHQKMEEARLAFLTQKAQLLAQCDQQLAQLDDNRELVTGTARIKRFNAQIGLIKADAMCLNRADPQSFIDDAVKDILSPILASFYDSTQQVNKSCTTLAECLIGLKNRLLIAEREQDIAQERDTLAEAIGRHRESIIVYLYTVASLNDILKKCQASFASLRSRGASQATMVQIVGDTTQDEFFLPDRECLALLCPSKKWRLSDLDKLNQVYQYLGKLDETAAPEEPSLLGKDL